ncbi:hypothetical protein IAU59_000231 [Kwoniella sp. CBS 9459]
MPSDPPPGAIKRPFPRIGPVDSAALNSMLTFEHLEIEGDLHNNLFPKEKIWNKDRNLYLSLQPEQDQLSQSRRQRFRAPIHGGEAERLDILPLRFGGAVHHRALWKIFRGKLTFKSSTDGLEYGTLPVVAKYMRPRNFPEVRQPDNWLFEEHGHHTRATAWSEALNEDAILRGLIQLQGTIVPNYYGLYGLSRSQKPAGAAPDIVVMIMEDVGEQRFPPGCRSASDFTIEQRRDIIAHYEALHQHGQVVQHDLRVNENHMLQRQVGHRYRFAIIDFQKAKSLVGLSSDERSSWVETDEGALVCHLGYIFRRDSNGVLCGADGAEIKL